MTTRLFFAAGALAAIGALVLAYLLQYVGGLEPCPLCIFQRVAMAGVALSCIAGWIHNGGDVATRTYAALATFAAAMGVIIAGRHVWLMHLPPDQVPACGPGLDYLIQIMPLRDVVATVFRGDASCATVRGSFLHISLPAWSLIYFIGLTLGGLYGLIRVPGHRANHS